MYYIRDEEFPDALDIFIIIGEFGIKTLLFSPIDLNEIPEV